MSAALWEKGHPARHDEREVGTHCACLFGTMYIEWKCTLSLAHAAHGADDTDVSGVGPGGELGPRGQEVTTAPSPNSAVLMGRVNGARHAQLLVARKWFGKRAGGRGRERSGGGGEDGRVDHWTRPPRAPSPSFPHPLDNKQPASIVSSRQCVHCGPMARFFFLTGLLLFFCPPPPPACCLSVCFVLMRLGRLSHSPPDSVAQLAERLAACYPEGPRFNPVPSLFFFCPPPPCWEGVLPPPWPHERPAPPLRPTL